MDSGRTDVGTLPISEENINGDDAEDQARYACQFQEECYSNDRCKNRTDGIRYYLNSNSLLLKKRKTKKALAEDFNLGDINFRKCRWTRYSSDRVEQFQVIKSLFPPQVIIPVIPI
jgi:hypothetical protein